jgi:hypothetical protein
MPKTPKHTQPERNKNNTTNKEKIRGTRHHNYQSR